jgi:hypothetical protein
MAVMRMQRAGRGGGRRPRGAPSPFLPPPGPRPLHPRQAHGPSTPARPTAPPPPPGTRPLHPHRAHGPSTPARHTLHCTMCVPGVKGLVASGFMSAKVWLTCMWQACSERGRIGHTLRHQHAEVHGKHGQRDRAASQTHGCTIQRKNRPSPPPPLPPPPHPVLTSSARTARMTSLIVALSDRRQ